MLISLLKIENLFKFLLLCWCISIPFKNAFYQLSTFSIVLFFLISLFNKNNFNFFKALLMKYKDVYYALIFIFLSMTISNIINDVYDTKAYHLELMFFLRYVLVSILLIYFYLKFFFTKTNLLTFILISVSIQSLDGLYQAIYGIDFFKSNIGDLGVHGLTGATFNRNTFGFIMGSAVLILILYYQKIFLLEKNKILFFLMFLLFSFNILFSYSRAVWLSLFISIVFLFFINKSMLKKNIIYLIIFSMVLIMIFINYHPLYHRLYLLLNGFSADRFMIWSEAIRLINESILFGYGIDTWKANGVKNFASIHNSFLEIFYYLGSLGVFSFSYLLYLTIREIYKEKRFLLFVLLVYFFVNSQFDQSIITSKIFLSILTIFMFFVFCNRIEKTKYS